MIPMILLAAAGATLPLDIAGLTERSPQEIVCELTGDCGGRPGGARAPRPKEPVFDVDGIAANSLEVQFAKVRAARARVASTATGSR